MSRTPSPWLQNLRRLLRHDTKRSNRRVVYTCLFGYSEPFLDQELEDDGKTDFVCFTDDPSLESDFWTIVQAPPSLLDSHRRSKGFKHRPHLLFPEHQASLYIDNTVILDKSPNRLFDILNKSQFKLLMFAHPWRQCVYDEAEAVISAGYDDLEIVNFQMSRYRSLGYPTRNGLNAATIMLRFHNDRQIKNAMDEWYYQTLRYSKRDQLSFDVIRHFHGLRIGNFEGTLTDNALMTWPAVPGGKRLPRDFDDTEYLTLHPDVAEAGVNPRKHYLDHGIGEGRPYRVASK